MGLMIYVIYCAVFGFSLFTKYHHWQYYFYYFTYWNATLAAILMTAKFASSISVYQYIRNDIDEEDGDVNSVLYDKIFGTNDSNSWIWRLHIFHKIFLYAT